MWDAAYTVGPHMYHSTRRPLMGMKGVFVRVMLLKTLSG